MNSGLPDPARTFDARYALIVIGAIVVLTLALFLSHVSLLDVLFNLTGEENLGEGIKGVGALLLLRITQSPLDTEPYTPMPHTGLNPYGVNTFLEQEVEEAKVRRSLAMIRDAGFGWIRQEFPWEDIEIHGKGDFEDRRTEPHKSAWSKYDRIVALAEAHGLEIVARVDNPPAWSRHASDAQGTLAPPDNLADYGDFVYEVVRRYRGRIRYVQLWNEPNIYPEWGESPVDPEAYTGLLQVGYVRAKEADPDVVVLSAGLAPTVETGPRNLSDLIFLQRMYAAGAKDYFDVLAVMGYGLWTGPTDQRASADRTNFARLQLIRDSMVKHGDAAKPVWIMEMGWNAVPPDLPAPFGRVTPEQQARYTILAYQRIQDEWPWVGVAFTWYFRRPDWEWHRRPEGYFRLVEPDFIPMPVYHSLRKLATSPPVVSMGYHQEDHWALSWATDWQVIGDERAILGAYRATRQPGAGLSFTFRGTDLDLVVVRVPDGGTIEATVDRQATARIDLHSPRAEFGVDVPIAQGLPYGEHRVEIVASDPGQVGIDGVIVRHGASVWWRPTLAGLLLAGFALSLAILWQRLRRQTT